MLWRERVEENTVAMDEWLNKRVGYAALYTGVFAVLALVVFSPFIIAGNSFVWQVDGVVQHTKALSFYGAYLRDVAHSIVSGAPSATSTFSFALGYGGDILGSLSYYVVGDPLNVLAVFVPEEATPVLYTALVVVRLYLAGLAFSLFAGYALDVPPAGKLAGALTFVFCGYALFAGVRHPYFVNPLICLPLVLFGVEKVLRERRHVPLALAIALSAVSNFYFFYMVFLVMALYIVMRLVAIHRAAGARAGLARAAADFGHLVGAGVIGVLISCIVFLPVVLFFLQDTRAGVDVAVPLLFSEKFYSLVPINLSTSAAPGKWTYLSVGIVGIVAIVSLFSERRANTQLKVALVAMFVMLCIPLFGHVFNGFSYVSNRWSWAFSFACACAIAVRWEALMSMSRKQALVLCGVVGAYLVVSTVASWRYMPHAGLVIAVALWALSVAAIAIGAVRNARYQTRGSALFAECLTVVVVCAGIALNALAIYSPVGGGYASHFLSWSEVPDLYQTEANAVAALADGESGGEGEDGGQAASDGFYRYTGAYTLVTRNAGALAGVSSTSSYWSLADAHTKRFFADMGINGSDSAGCSWYNVDGHSTLDEFVGARYYVAGRDESAPFGFKEKAVGKGSYFDPVEKLDKSYRIFESKHPLPFSFTYASALPADDASSLEPRARREAVLQTALLGEGASAATASEIAVAPEDLELTSKVVPFELEAGKNVELKKGSIKTTKANAQVTLTVDASMPEKVEPSIQITDLVCDPKVHSTIIEAEFTFADDTKRTCPIDIASPSKNTFEPYHWITESPGYSTARLEKVTLTFPNKGTYAYGGIQLIAQPMAGFGERARALTKDVLEDVDMHCLSGRTLATSRVTGRISLDEPKVLCTQIPYAAGWSVRVDGEEAELLQVGSLLCGVALGPGAHEVEFVYATPGLIVGALLSLAGFALLALTFALERRQRERASSQASDTSK